MAKKSKQVLELAIVVFSCLLAVLIRLFAVVINEPIIHEFDPHFNWRCTQYIDQHGLYEFLGWFDNISWYPQGRPVGETTYPGLMYTAAILKWTLQKCHIMIDLIDFCIYMGPIASVGIVLVSFLYGKLLGGSTLGCVVCFINSFIAGLISRSIAGSYDYECIAFFILITCFYFFSLALENGSILYATLSALFYGYMALTWGGYVFISNCIPLYVAVLVALGRYSWRLHIVYSIWAVLGTIFTSSVPFIFEKTISKPEHLVLLLTFFVLQVWGLFVFLKGRLSKRSFSTFLVSSLISLPAVVMAIITLGVSTGLLSGFSGRLMQMFDPTYGAHHVAIIASVAEHQASSWGAFFMDCGYLLLLFPLGCYFILKTQTESEMLILIYGLSTMYFGSVMVRLVLVFTPAMVFVSSIAIHRLMKKATAKKDGVSMMVMLTITIIVLATLYHCVWFACYSYSGDHIHFMVNTPRGGETSDDYREAYRWLFSNTQRDERVMSWWDYGYQITSMGNRGCMADGNTNNYTHIGIIGMAMASQEPVSWRLARLMGADYMLVVFGGASGYDGDDINKFMWMPRIANQTFTNISGGLYMQPRQPTLVGAYQTHNMTNSMMFKFCYHNFKRFRFHPSVPNGYDLARRDEIKQGLDIRLKNFEEAYTTKNWILRIYKVKGDPIWNRVY